MYLLFLHSRSKSSFQGNLKHSKHLSSNFCKVFKNDNLFFFLKHLLEDVVSYFYPYLAILFNRKAYTCEEIVFNQFYHVYEVSNWQEIYSDMEKTSIFLNLHATYVFCMNIRKLYITLFLFYLFCLFVCFFVCLGFIVPLENFSLIWRRLFIL